MARIFGHSVSYSDEELRHAITTNRSWAGVMRALGKHPTSQGSKRAAQRRAAQLKLSTGHFTGQRRWDDQHLREAVASCSSWNAVLRHMGIASTSPGSIAAAKSHAVRLGLSVEHLIHKRRPEPSTLITSRVDLRHLRTAAPAMAMTWFHLRGFVTSPPMEPLPYDFVADTPQGLLRVQVKSTTRQDPKWGGYVVSIAPRRTHGEHKDVSMPYDPERSTCSSSRRRTAGCI